MVEEDTDIVRTTKSEKKTLLERYDIPVEHLSYEHISECTNAKKLERIVTILRSGEEGYYPDLTKHAEQRLAAIKPTSIILRKSEPILTRSMLDPSEYKEIDKDIDHWMSEMQIREKDLEEGKCITEDAIVQPDIRQYPDESTKKNPVISLKHNSNKNKRIAGCDYAAWDKYDADTELNKIDIREEQQKIQAKQLQHKQKEKFTRMKLEKHSLINKSSLTGTELDVMAEQEREKGNEAFRAGDYEEALEHYNTSVKINSNIITFNNRAMTYIKLQRYEDAVNDCNLVISAEHMNIKAVLRRAVALEHLEKLSQALIDYEAVLKLEPTNAVAISGVKRLRKPCESKKVRMSIEEQSESINDELTHHEAEEQKYCNTPFTSPFNLASSICYCDRAPGSSQNLRPRPHIKADYCLENERKETSKSKNKSALESTKKPISPANNRVSNTAKSTQGNINSTAKQKSIFSCATLPKQSSSVIIEEVPNEPSNNTPVNTKKTPVESVANKCNSNAKTRSKCKLSDGKGLKTSNANNLSKNNVQSSNPVQRLFMKPPSRTIQVANKYDNKTSKEETFISKDFNNVETSYEFVRIWRSLQHDTDLKAHAQLLRAINIEKLNLVLGNELDGNMLSTILRCLERHFCTPEDMVLLNTFLKSFCQMKRFSIVNMFLNTEDKRVVKNILNFLEEHGTSEVSSLRQIYCI